MLQEGGERTGESHLEVIGEAAHQKGHRGIAGSWSWGLTTPWNRGEESGELGEWRGVKGRSWEEWEEGEGCEEWEEWEE